MSAFSRWFLRNRDDLLRDAAVAVVCGLALLAAAKYFDDRREDSAQARAQQQAERDQELAKKQALTAEMTENMRFVRQAVMAPGVTLKPFSGLYLRNASLAGLPLGCPRGDIGGPGCAKMASSDLRDADLSYANLRGADLQYADLRKADLTGANLRGAILNYAKLDEANLSLADLRKADFFEAKGIKSAKLEQVCFDGETTWPDHFEPPRMSC